MLKYIESCRSCGLPNGNLAKEETIFEKRLETRDGMEIEATGEVEVPIAIGQEDAASSWSVKSSTGLSMC